MTTFRAGGRADSVKGREAFLEMGSERIGIAVD